MTTINSEDRALIELKPLVAGLAKHLRQLIISWDGQEAADAVNEMAVAQAAIEYIAARTEGSTEARASGEAWKPDREAVARLIHFMHGDGLSAEDAMRPTNDAHWDFWKDDPSHADAWRAVDAILSLGEARQGEGDA